MGLREGRAKKRTGGNGYIYSYQGGGYVERTHERFQDHPRNIKTEKRRKEDSRERLEIQGTIITLRDKYGKSEREILAILKDKFPVSQYRGYFEGWVENACKTKYGYNGKLDYRTKRKLKENTKEEEER